MLGGLVDDLGVAGPERRICPQSGRDTESVGIRETAMALILAASES
jgi:hypothetical protein